VNQPLRKPSAELVALSKLVAITDVVLEDAQIKASPVALAAFLKTRDDARALIAGWRAQILELS
jgi:hypothetical protein